jgi:hypothetical protein
MSDDVGIEPGGGMKHDPARGDGVEHAVDDQSILLALLGDRPTVPAPIRSSHAALPKGHCSRNATT